MPESSHEQPWPDLPELSADQQAEFEIAVDALVRYASSQNAQNKPVHFSQEAPSHHVVLTLDGTRDAAGNLVKGMIVHGRLAMDAIIEAVRHHR